MSHISVAYIEEMARELNLSADEVAQRVIEFFEFPRDKRQIARLDHERKMEWYALQFQRNPGGYPVELTTAEFARFWKWRVLMPMKVKRFLYRVKNFEIFKRYPHISEMRPKAKKHGI